MKPMLCSYSSAASGRRGTSYEHLLQTGDWIGDLKLDGVRAMAHWSSATGLTLTNRQEVPINRRYPEVVKALTVALTGYKGPIILDGEIVALDGRFETTLLRDKQQDVRTIQRMAEQHPVTFIAFDMPDERRPDKPWIDRRADLDRLSRAWGATPPGILGATVQSDDPGFLALTRTQGLEGVVAKRLNGRYEFGKRSKNWIKFRNLWTITCLATGYTPGTGSRAEFGAMQLQLIDEDTGSLVDIGRCGTGFTDREIGQLKELLDTHGILPVEIECANLTKERTLRFPVYRHIRTDVSVHDITTEQLESLPTC